MTTEWWYEDSIYHLDQTVVLARLTNREDGSAQILTDGGETLEFPTRDEAEMWLGDEEYSPLESLMEDRAEEGLPADPRLQPPTASSGEELLRQMVIPLEPANGVAATEQSKAQRTPTQAE